MKWYPSILEVEKADELKALFKVFIFHFEFRFRHTIKRDASLSGLRKIECSSIKIKSKERHSSTSQARRIFFGDFWCEKSRCNSELPTPVESPDALSLSLHGDCRHRKSRLRSGVPTPRPLASLLTAFVGCPNVRRENWPSEVPTYTGCFDVDLPC